MQNLCMFLIHRKEFPGDGDVNCNNYTHFVVNINNSLEDCMKRLGIIYNTTLCFLIDSVP